MEDSGIVALFWNREERAINEFNNKYGRLCFSMAKNITGSDESAEECLSDLTMRLWTSIPPERPGSLKAFALRIIRNIAISVFRSEHAKKRSAVIVELEECESETAVFGEDQDLTALLNEFLETLDRESAKVFLKRYLYSEPVKTIAADMGVRENRVSKILMKTREKLKVFLAERGVDV